MSTAASSQVLLIPQWQGYAAGDGPQRGARAIAAALGAQGPVHAPAHAIEVPAWHALAREAANGERGGEALCARPLTAAQVVMAGTRELDPAERDFLRASGIPTWPPSAIGDGSVLAVVRAHPARHWHVHFDLDVLDPDDFPDVTVPAPGGPTLGAVTGFLEELVAEHDVVGLTVTEHVGGEASARRIADTVAALGRAGWP